MISWVVVIIVLLVGLILIKFKHLNYKVTLFVFLLLFLFICTTIFIVSKNNQLDLSTTQGAIKSVQVYFAWLGNGFNNLKQITGYAIGMNWTESNSSKIDEKVNPVMKK